MLQLLVPVPLDSLQKCTQRLLLLLPQECFLLLDGLLHFVANLVIVFLLLHLLALYLKELSFFVSFHKGQFFHFVLQFH